MIYANFMKKKNNKTIKVIDLLKEVAEGNNITFRDGGEIYKDLWTFFNMYMSDKLSFNEIKELLNSEVVVIEESEQEIDKTTTKHVMIDEENLKNLIRNHYRWEDYTLQGKIDIVTSLAYFDNSNDLIDFIKYVGV